MATKPTTRMQRISFVSERLHLITRDAFSTLLIFCERMSKRGGYTDFYFHEWQRSNIEEALSESMPIWSDVFTLS